MDKVVCLRNIAVVLLVALHNEKKKSMRWLVTSAHKYQVNKNINEIVSSYLILAICTNGLCRGTHTHTNSSYWYMKWHTHTQFMIGSEMSSISAVFEIIQQPSNMLATPIRAHLFICSVVVVVFFMIGVSRQTFAHFKLFLRHDCRSDLTKKKIQITQQHT